MGLRIKVQWDGDVCPWYLDVSPAFILLILSHEFIMKALWSHQALPFLCLNLSESSPVCHSSSEAAYLLKCPNLWELLKVLLVPRRLPLQHSLHIVDRLMSASLAMYIALNENMLDVNVIRSGRQSPSPGCYLLPSWTLLVIYFKRPREGRRLGLYVVSPWFFGQLFMHVLLLHTPCKTFVMREKSSVSRLSCKSWHQLFLFHRFNEGSCTPH